MWRDTQPPMLQHHHHHRPDDYTLAEKGTIARLITCGGQMRYGNRSRWGRWGSPSDTVLVRGRWTRDIDHDEQTECLKLAASLDDVPSLWLHGLFLGPSEAEVLSMFPTRA